MFLNDLKNRLQPHALPTLFTAECLTPGMVQKSAGTSTDTLAVEIRDISPILSPSSDFTLDSSLGASNTCSSKSVQTPNVWTSNIPRKVFLHQQLMAEKEGRIHAEKAVILLSNQLAELILLKIF